jgi:hypothetical protein
MEHKRTFISHEICIVCYNKHVTRLHTDIFEHITSLVMALFLKWAMERSRNRVNRGVRSYLLKIAGYAIKHLDLDDGHKALFTHS